jgi:hypothetical protein
MPKKYNIICAHPDDEVLFFSSILKDASSVIICFTETQDKTVTMGRKNIKKFPPLKNYLFLDLIEPNAFNSANWNSPTRSPEGLTVSRNKYNYVKSYQGIKLKLSKILKFGDTIYTHNPWGEYGHEEHVQVFRVLKELSNKLNLKIFVTGYVSNKSYNLMKMKIHLLSNIGQFKTIDKMLTNRLKNVYISNSCWTFDDFYMWPKNEIFFELKNIAAKFNSNKKNKLIGLLNYMPGNYKVNFIKKILSYVLPYGLKKKILATLQDFKKKQKLF